MVVVFFGRETVFFLVVVLTFFFVAVGFFLVVIFLDTVFTVFVGIVTQLLHYVAKFVEHVLSSQGWRHMSRRPLTSHSSHITLPTLVTVVEGVIYRTLYVSASLSEVLVSTCRWSHRFCRTNVAASDRVTHCEKMSRRGQASPALQISGTAKVGQLAFRTHPLALHIRRQPIDMPYTCHIVLSRSHRLCVSLRASLRANLRANLRSSLSLLPPPAHTQGVPPDANVIYVTLCTRAMQTMSGLWLR